MDTLDFERRVKRNLEMIEASDDIHPDNKAAINRFKRDLSIDGVSDAWLQKLTSHLKVIAEHLGPDTRFEDLDEEAMRDLVEWFHQRDITESTINSYKQVTKRFYRWLYDLPKGEHPDVTDWINTGSRIGNDTLPKDLLTREDIRALLDATTNPRDRAYIAVLWETGARIGELIDLRVGDIEEARHGRKVVLEGKTGARRIKLVEAVPYINRWLNEHPKPEDDAPLWCKLRNYENDEAMGYRGLRKAVDRAADTAGIDKPVNPHHFRHSRATYLANELTEAQLCQYFGWVQGSDVPSKYVHLSGRDLDMAIDRLHGIEPEDGDEEEDAVIVCWRCEEVNGARDRYCGRCGAPLDEDASKVQESVQQDVGVAKALADLENAGDLSPEEVEALAQDDELMAQLIRARADRLDE